MIFIVTAIFTAPMIKLIVLFLMAAISSHSWALSDLKELEYSEQIESSSPVGNIVWLQNKTSRFISLYTETEDKKNSGTAIIIHPKGGHPDQQNLINPLRTYLPEHNWATLSIQMPVLGVHSSDQEYYPFFDQAKQRIQTAVDYLLNAGVKNIVIVGYGLGATMALYYLNENAGNEDVKALVTISLGVPDSSRKEGQVINFMSQVKQPFLDIYAELDLPEVTKNARSKRIAGRTNDAYRQFEIEGEGHLYQHDEGLVVKRIYSWMERVFKKFRLE